MVSDFNLISQPWIKTLGAHGTATLSLRDTLMEADKLRQVTTGSYLADAAITEMLVAIIIAADAHTRSGLSWKKAVENWLADHYKQFNLFDKSTPFGQYIPLKEVPQPASISALLYEFNTSDAPFSSYDSLINPTSGVILTPAEAACLLLVRQRFSVGGLQSKTARTLTGVTSALNALKVNYPVIIPRTGILAKDLSLTAHSITADSTAARGTLHLGISSSTELGKELITPGVLDVLSYPSRSIYLYPDNNGNITHAHIGEAYRLTPEALNPTLWPTTTWTTSKDSIYPRKVQISRPGWLHVLNAIADNVGGILTTDILPPRIPLTLTTIVAYKARIDGIYHHRSIMPVLDHADIQEFIQQIDGFYKNIEKDNYSLGHKLSGNISNDSFAKTLSAEVHPEITRQLNHIAANRLSGAITSVNVQDQLRDLIKTNQQRAISFINAHPGPAIAVMSRYHQI